MATRLEFAALTPTQQNQANARFMDARNGDGYLYELDISGEVLCRQRTTFTRGQPAPILAGGRLVHQSTD